ncbi:MAG: LamG-like jellyroll fold domain-containing protein, partial [Candidatus Rokuibacteriota bacterium]
AFTQEPTPPPPAPPPPPPATGLVAAYTFDEGTGATVADSSGNGNTGLVAGATWTPQGRFGGALVFDGVSSWVAISDAASLDLTAGLTLEAWVFPTAITGWRTVILKEQPGQQVYALYASSSTSTPAGQVFVSAAGQRVHAPSAIPVNAWTHLATTYDGAIQRLYVNGVEVATRAQSGAVRVSDNPLRIGGNSVWGEFFQGRIDEVRIYARVLTPSDIQADMNTPVSAGGEAMAAAAGQVALLSEAPAATPSSAARLSTSAGAPGESPSASGPGATLVSTSIEGTVFAADRSTPVPESLVELLAPGTGVRLAATMTAANGTYRFAGVAGGGEGTIVRAHSPTAFSLIAEQRTSSRSRSVDLILPLSVVRGHVSFASGMPARFPTVFLESAGGFFFSFASVSDELGQFVVFGAPPGAFTLSVQDSDSGLLRTIGGQLSRLEVPTTLAVQLPPSISLIGRVMGPDGNAVPFASVALESVGPNFVRFARADANGVYAFHDVAVGPVSVMATSVVDGRQLFGSAAGHLAQSASELRLDLVLTDVSR